MAAHVIDGKQAAASVIAEVTGTTSLLKSRTGIKPGLAVVIVGKDAASHAYVQAKSAMAKRCGFHSMQLGLPEQTARRNSRHWWENSIPIRPSTAFWCNWHCPST